MIDYIKGEIAELTPAYVVLETAGIGYLIHITLPTFSFLGEQTTVKLFVYEVIREDAHVLYGFRYQSERQLFLLLISVSGIGANTARMIMSSYSAQEIQEMIASGNVSALNAIKGIGTKTAQRIIVDLKDKIVKGTGGGEMPNLVTNKQTEEKEEAVSALVMLGFASAASQKTVERILREQPTLRVEQLIKLALKMM
ncbi:MAG: Holliday junction branch migration protein RuvA [Bacteroidota bacterium]|nr:Holliday junction branch migration protein RuvA [Bacteroidota bacterium]